MFRIGKTTSLISRLKADTHRAQQTSLFAALRLKAASLVLEGHEERAINVLDHVIDDVGSTDEPGGAREAALALACKSLALQRLGRDEEALRTEDDMASRFGNEAVAAFDAFTASFAGCDEPAVRECLASAVLAKAGVLCRLEREEEAVQVLSDLVDRFGEDSSGGVRTIAEQALRSREDLLRERNGGR
jgi:hypothetical protein